MNIAAACTLAWNSVLDAILPPRARTARTRALSLEAIPLTVRAHDLLGARITTLMDYRAAEVHDLIQSLKYDGSAKAASLCAGVLAEYLREELIEAKAFSQKDVLLVPVPLHSSRERERGFNQITLALRALPSEFRNGPLSHVIVDALERTRATKQQTHFSRSERLSNVAGAFAVRDPSAFKGTRVYLIDDVATTGATLINAANPLRRAGADVHLIALARA